MKSSSERVECENYDDDDDDDMQMLIVREAWWPPRNLLGIINAIYEGDDVDWNVVEHTPNN